MSVLRARNAAVRAGHQRGVVLIVCLLFLLVITLTATTTMNTTILEERMAANHQYRAVSFQIAESALSHFTTPGVVLQTFDYPQQRLPAEMTDLGRVFDPVAGGAIATAASADVSYCGQRAATGTGRSSSLQLGGGVALRVFSVRGRGAVPVAGAAAANEHVVALYGSADGSRRCARL